ncbi:MarR family transcriptional regulator [Candidatus Woesearchaeota archaeon]|nr:MarR family transcriptional regulator [Candidatus Woesearchaeota archaeon]
MENVKPLPKWVMKTYADLWANFKRSYFSFKDASEKLKIPRERLSVIISELNKSGWIEVKLDKKDARKRDYKLKEPDEAVIGMSSKFN